MENNSPEIETAENKAAENLTAENTATESAAPKTNHSFIKGIILGALMAILLAMILCLITGTVLVRGLKQAQNNQTASTGTETVGLTNSAKMKIEFIENFIRQKGYYDLDEIDFESGLYQGLIDALDDPYAEYYTAEEAALENADDAGKFYGIGATLSKNTETGECVITNVQEDSPSDKAGLQVEDRILTVEGEDCTQLSLDEIVSRVRGDKDTAVHLTVRREGEDDFDMEIIRDEIVLESITSRMLDDEIGYIRIEEFSGTTPDQFDEALDDLKAQGMKKIIFDLRYNTGGSFESVVKMLDTILPEGVVVYTEDKDGTREDSVSDANCLDCPMVVLVNRYTASAAEIFTAAVQDFGAGTIIGETTFGKGIVQGVYKLYDGSCIKFTIQKYFTPKGKCIHGEGITPDIETETRWVGDEDAEEYDELFDSDVLTGMRELGADVEIPEPEEEEE